jgi:peptidoglycan DL-endopeptidase CwlO
LLLRTARRLLRVTVLAAIAIGVLTPLAPAAAATKPTLSQLQQQIKVQSAALEKVVEQYDKVRDDLKANVAHQKDLAAKLGPTIIALTDSRDMVAKIAKSTYMRGQMTSFSALLTGGGNTTALLNELTTLNQVATSQHQQVATLERLNDAYLTQKAAIDNLVKAQQAQQASLTHQTAVIKAKLKALYKLRTEAYGSPTTASPSSHPAPPYLPGRGGKIVDFAYAQLGKPYVWGADGPGSYDCSGLVMAAYRTVGISLPHNAASQWGVVSHISRSALSPGDLVFYSGLGHVAIYIGNNKVIHAPQAGENVSIASVTMMTPYGYGRV